MNKHKRLWLILVATLKRWVEDTPEDKIISEKQLYKDLLEYLEELDRRYSEDIM